jgi:GcrA cell cycle regulator
MSAWTDERVEQLRDHVLAGMSAGKIAGELGMSRSAVIGKAYRLGLSFAALDCVAPRPRAPRPTALQIRPGRKSTYGGEVRAIVLPPLPKNGSEPLPDSRMLPLVELNMSTDCRWPFGEPRSPDFRYCGAPRAWPGNDLAGCYCGGHTRLVKTARAA